MPPTYAEYGLQASFVSPVRIETVLDITGSPMIVTMLQHRRRVIRRVSAAPNHISTNGCEAGLSQENKQIQTILDCKECTVSQFECAVLQYVQTQPSARLAKKKLKQQWFHMIPVCICNATYHVNCSEPNLFMTLAALMVVNTSVSGSSAEQQVWRGLPRPQAPAHEHDNARLTHRLAGRRPMEWAKLQCWWKHLQNQLCMWNFLLI